MIMSRGWGDWGCDWISVAIANIILLHSHSQPHPHTLHRLFVHWAWFLNCKIRKLFRVHKIVEKCPKFLFHTSKSQFLYSIVSKSKGFSENPFEKPAKYKRIFFFISCQLLPESSGEWTKPLLASSFRFWIITVFSLIFYFEMVSS